MQDIGCCSPLPVAPWQRWSSQACCQSSRPPPVQQLDVVFVLGKRVGALPHSACRSQVARACGTKDKNEQHWAGWCRSGSATSRRPNCQQQAPRSDPQPPDPPHCRLTPGFGLVLLWPQPLQQLIRALSRGLHKPKEALYSRQGSTKVQESNSAQIDRFGHRSTVKMCMYPGWCVGFGSVLTESTMTQPILNAAP